VADWLGRLDTVRIRLTVGAVAVVGVAMLIGSIALVSFTRQTLMENLQQSAQIRAEELATALEGAASPALLYAVADDQLIQVIDPRGVVTAASENIAGRPLLVRLEAGETARLEEPIPDEGDFLAVAAAADTPDGPRTVVFARSSDDVFDLTVILAQGLVIGLPLLLIIVGLTTWRIVGRALAPVDAIRREVDEITGRELDRRVPVPPRRDEIARLATTMNHMLGRLQDSQARQRRFVSDASHELRSPVASIRQHGEVALSHPDRTSVAQLARTVLAEDLRIQHLVEDLLLLARTDEQDVAHPGVIVDLDDIVFEEAARLRHRTRSGVVVDTTGVSAGRVRGVREDLRRMIGNLGDNAMRHAQSRVRIALHERTDEGVVVLRVDDDGAGVADDQRLRVFERFVRLDDARSRDSGGSGLGLAIVEAVARTHEGSVTVTDSPDGGARFEVRLPLQAD